MTYVVDVAALILATVVFLGYHARLHLRVRRKTSTDVSYIAAEARRAWVRGVMRSPNDSILAVQTLRNSTMAATFLASTAILLMIGVLTLSSQIVNSPSESGWHLLNIFGAVDPEVWLAKTVCMLIVLFFTFFCFSNAIRIFNHVGYMINARSSPTESVYSPDVVANELNRAGLFYSVGMRAYYYLIPLVCWLFGPLYLMVSTIVLVFLLLPWIDRTKPPSSPQQT